MLPSIRANGGEHTRVRWAAVNKMDIGNKGLWVVNRVKLLSTFAVNERGNRTAIWGGLFGQPILQFCDEISVGPFI
jgi:hypothetical protein